MRTVRTVAEVRMALAEARLHGEPIGLVPTMGAFHAGHLALFEAAREPRRLRIVPGVGHNDLVQAMGPSYGTEVAAWLA